MENVSYPYCCQANPPYRAVEIRTAGSAGSILITHHHLKSSVSGLKTLGSTLAEEIKSMNIKVKLFLDVKCVNLS